MSEIKYATENSDSLRCSEFLAESINGRLDRLRMDVGMYRHAVNEWRRRTYWDESDDSQHKRFRHIRRSQQRVKLAEAELRKFVAEHRSLMGQEWVGNDHGRLCLASFVGGYPIDHHFCTKPEGHDGFCQNDKGAWPKGVFNSHTWHAKIKGCRHLVVIENGNTFACRSCGKAMG